MISDLIFNYYLYIEKNQSIYVRIIGKQASAIKFVGFFELGPLVLGKNNFALNVYFFFMLVKTCLSLEKRSVVYYYEDFVNLSLNSLPHVAAFDQSQVFFEKKAYSENKMDLLLFIFFATLCKIFALFAKMSTLSKKLP